MTQDETIHRPKENKDRGTQQHTDKPAEGDEKVIEQAITQQEEEEGKEDKQSDSMRNQPPAKRQ